MKSLLLIVESSKVKSLNLLYCYTVRKRFKIHESQNISFLDAPNIISIAPDEDDDENEVEIVLEARGTNLQLSWLLDDVKLNNSISGVEITNNINSNTNGVSRSKLELSKDMLRSITKPIQLTAIASNIDRSNCSDLRGISSSCAVGSQIRNDSVFLWLYPAPRPGKIDLYHDLIIFNSQVC